MATLIPDIIRDQVTNGEYELSRLLKRLPEGWTVYYEPNVNGLSPDFVILAPNLGLLVIEVKDWSINSVLSVNPETIEIKGRDGRASSLTKNPLRQLRGYWQAVKDACSDCKYGQELLHKTGEYRGRLCFPVGVLVWFTTITPQNVKNSEHKEVLETMFTAENTVFADRKRALNELDEAGLVAALKPFFRPFTMNQSFTAHQIDILRWVLFRESRLDVILGRNPAQSEAAMEVLDARQEQHAKSLGSGHYVLSGVAGSGKTVLLMARARWLAAKHPEKCSLLLCFNKVLAEWLKARMRDCPNVTVTHFDGWAKSVGLTRKEKDAAVFGARVMSAITKRGDAARVWDSVLIDEAQDFEPIWFQCALAVMKDPIEGDLVIVADGSQRLYKRNKVTWVSLGIKATGQRSISARFDLDKNYRNTPEIAGLAGGFIENERVTDGINSIGVGTPSCRRGSVGSNPTFVAAPSHAEQIDAALEIARRWLQGERLGKEFCPIKPEDIGVFYPRLREPDAAEMRRLVDGLSELAQTRWLSAKDGKAHEAVNDAAIKVQTIHSSKGLQYKAVIVLWTDQLSHSSATTEDRRELYVAITRAENDLVLLGSEAQECSQEFSSKCRVRRSTDLATRGRGAS